jgi:hypothetical protein
MPAILGMAILSAACAFMLYVLAQFHLEASRPARGASVPQKGVIAFRRRGEVKPGRVIPNPSSGEDVAVVLSIGVRRLAAKRAARS